jgi:hypothetical protein
MISQVSTLSDIFTDKNILKLELLLAEFSYLLSDNKLLLLA